MSLTLAQQLLQQYRRTHGQLLICLSGLSGAGKTYHAQQLSQLLGFHHIDQDQFYRSPASLPRVQLSNGQSCANWDCPEALDLGRMNDEIDQHVAQGVIFSGFACRDQWFRCLIDCQIHLAVTADTCYQRSQQRADGGRLGGLSLLSGDASAQPHVSHHRRQPQKPRHH